MTREVINQLKNYTLGKMNTDKVKISVLMLNRIIKALEQEPFMNKPCISSEVCEHDKNKVLDKIKDEIEKIPTAPPFATARTAKHEALEIIDKYKAKIEAQRER